ncbi:hypothetical protein ACFYS7_38810 [Streptomyces avermitilis]|uniref:hypothetical protein n=1 Tax=Streptomyces avermitilis TaxID=33903 RepID=UPI0036BACC85
MTTATGVGLLLGSVAPAQSAMASASVAATPLKARSEQVSSIAAPAVSTDPGGVYPSGGYCHFVNWGGSFFCQQAPEAVDVVAWTKPDRYMQVFVIGTNQHVFTRWASSSGTSSWLDMSGVCKPRFGLIGRPSGWSISIACVGTDDNWWHNTRSTSGSWSGWKKGGI